MNLIKQHIFNAALKLFLAAAIFALPGCFKDFKEDNLFRDHMIEFDATSFQSNAPGKTYPVLGPVEKGSGLQTFKVNLVGPQLSSAQSLQFRVVDEETSAQEGVHFKLANNGVFEFPANSSTAELSVEILNFPSENGLDTLVIELVENDMVKVSQNYKRIGLAIELTGPPDPNSALHTQLGPESYFNSIVIDPSNPDLSADFKTRLEEAATNLANYADGSRKLHTVYFNFAENNTLKVIALYFGGGGTTLTSGANATWTYQMNLDSEGKGTFTFIEANGNGNTQKANFAPILENYLEQYEFKIDWVDESISTPVTPGTQLGGFFQTSDPSSYAIGTLASASSTAATWPVLSSPALHEIFADNDSYFTTLLIDTDDPAQSDDFKTRWQDAKAYIQSQPAGRQLHKLMLYFNPTFSFNDARLVTYYYTSAGGKVTGQIRLQQKIDYDGNVNYEFVYQDANGGVTRTTQIVDDYLLNKEFIMTRNGDKVTFTQKDDPSSFFIGTLGNNSLTTSQFWPE